MVNKVANVPNTINRASGCDILLRRKDIMAKLNMKSNTTYQKWKRESGVKTMMISGGIECVWESDLLNYLEELRNHVA